MSEVAAQLGDVYKGAASAGRKRGGRARLGDIGIRRPRLRPDCRHRKTGRRGRDGLPRERGASARQRPGWCDVDEGAWWVPRVGAEGHAGLFRLAVPRCVQAGGVRGGGQLPASSSCLLIFLIVDEPTVGSVREQRPGCPGCRRDAFDLAFSIVGLGLYATKSLVASPVSQSASATLLMEGSSTVE